MRGVVGGRGVRRCALLTVLGVVGLGPMSSAAADERAFLQLSVNQVARGEVVAVLRDGDVLVRLDDLTGAGLRGLAGRQERLEGEVYVSLASLAPAVRFELDEPALALRLTVDPGLLPPTVLNLQVGPPPGIVYSQDASAFLNYALTLADGERLGLFGELGASLGPHRVFASAARTPEAGLVRGLTQYAYDDRRRLVRGVVGDTPATSGLLGASLVLGGVSLTREFDLDPYFVRYPTVGLAGAVLLPSTADIYVDGVLVRREALPPGPFRLENLPVPVGRGQTRVVLRDPFGREQEIGRPFYFTTALLAPGLHEFGYHLGFPREDAGRSSGEYGTLAFLGRHRVGLAPGLTAGGRLELSPDRASGGPTATAALPLGEVTLALAASRAGDRPGWAALAGYTYVGRPLSAGAAVRVLSDSYATLDLAPADDRPRWETTAFAGTQLTPRASLTVQYAGGELRDGGRRQRLSVVASLRLTGQLHLLAAAGYGLERASRRRGDPPARTETVTEGFLSLTYFFGGTSTASLGYQRQGDRNTGLLDVVQPLPVGPGVGYRLQGRLGDEREFAAGLLQYQGPYGRYEAGGEVADGRTATSLAVAGGVVALGGAVYPTRPVQESFGLLRVPGVEGVRGFVNNQEVGRTNARGDLPVPNLLAYYGNRVAIRDEDIPLDYRVDAVERTVAPPVRSGAVVAFPVRRIQALTGTLVVERAGETVVPAYGQLAVTAAGVRVESPIGRDGEFYLENLPAGRHPAVVEEDGTRCAFTLEVPASPAVLVELGTVRCVADGAGGTP